MTGAPRKPARLWIAGLFAVLGTVVIWAASMSRQDAQTRALSRRWLSDQWLVARTCLTGTGERGASVEAIAAELEARASEQGWPTRCLPALRSIRPAEQEAPGGLAAVHALEALIPGAAGSPERARELAAPIATLDQALPRVHTQ